MPNLAKIILIKVLKVVYDSWAYPAAKKYVESTENDYDDKVLSFINDMYKLLMVKISNI